MKILKNNISQKFDSDDMTKLGNSRFDCGKSDSHVVFQSFCEFLVVFVKVYRVILVSYPNAQIAWLYSFSRDEVFLIIRFKSTDIEDRRVEGAYKARK